MNRQQHTNAPPFEYCLDFIIQLSFKTRGHHKMTAEQTTLSFTTKRTRVYQKHVAEFWQEKIFGEEPRHVVIV